MHKLCEDGGPEVVGTASGCDESSCQKAVTNRCEIPRKKRKESAESIGSGSGERFKSAPPTNQSLSSRPSLDDQRDGYTYRLYA
jgi:hypothetical protein